MLVHMKKHHTNQNTQNAIFCFTENGDAYLLPAKIVQKFNQYEVKSISSKEKAIKNVIERLHKTPEEVFADLDKKYTKAGALLKGYRYREGMTQKELAEKLDITQGDLSKYENGKRPIGKILAKRIAKLVGTDYRSFL